MSDYFTKTASDARYYLNTVTLNNITVATGTINVNSQLINNLALCTADAHAASKIYVDTQISAISMGNSAPIGSVFMWCVTSIPTGYL